MTKADQLAKDYEAHRNSIGKRCRVEYLGGGRYRVSPLGGCSANLVPYVRTGSEIRRALGCAKTGHLLINVPRTT